MPEPACKGRVADYIAHTEMTVKARYTAPDRAKVAEIGFLFEQLQAMTAKVSVNANHDFPVSVSGVACTNSPAATAGPSAADCMNTKEHSLLQSTIPVKRKSKLGKLGKALSRFTGSTQPPESATGQSPSSRHHRQISLLLNRLSFLFCRHGTGRWMKTQSCRRRMKSMQNFHAPKWTTASRFVTR